MKKYWKVLLISMLIVIAISTYYIQAAFAAKSDITMKIETLNGNEEAIENLVVEVNHYRGNVNQRLKISKDGSTTIYNESLVRGMMSRYSVPELNKLVQEHRQFMRGKHLSPTNFFEDDSRLIYVDILTNINKDSGSGNLIFAVDILDKKTKERTSFEVQKQSSAGYNWGYISNIHVADGTIKIITTLNTQIGGSKLHLYEIDEQKQALTHEMLLVDVENHNNYRTNGFSLNRAETLGNISYYLYGVVKSSYEGEIETAEIYVYNTNTGELEELEVPSNFAPHLYNATTLGSELFIPIASNTGVELHHYNFETKQWVAPLNITYPQKMVEKNNNAIKILGDKIYNVYRIADGYMLLIHDLYSRESIYEGKFKIKDLTEMEWTTIYQIYHVE